MINGNFTLVHSRMLEFQSRNDMLCNLVKPDSVICEIGVWKGEFASFLLSLRPKHLVLVDPFQGTVSSGDEHGNNVKDAYLPLEYLVLNQKYKHNPNITLLRGYSHELLPHFAKETFDVMYIDGDHSYQGVKVDLALAKQLVKKNGLICGHDYEMNPAKTSNNYNFGVKQAVDEFCKQYDLELLAKGLDGQVSWAIQNN